MENSLYAEQAFDEQSFNLQIVLLKDNEEQPKWQYCLISELTALQSADFPPTNPQHHKEHCTKLTSLLTCSQTSW